MILKVKTGAVPDIRPEDRREPQLIGVAPMAGATYLPGESNSNGTLSAAVSASNAGKLEYVWTTSASTPTSGWRMVSSGTAVTTRQTSGTWYLHARATNNDGAVAAASKSYAIPTSGSGTMSLPELTISANNDSWAKTRAVTRKPANAIQDLTSTTHAAPVTLTFSVADGGSGVNSVSAKWNSTTATLTKNADSTYTTTSPNDGGNTKWKLTVTDDAGHFVSQVLNVTAPGGVLDGVAPDVRYDANPWGTTVEDIDISLDVFEEKGLSSLTWTDPDGVAHALSPAPVTGAAGSYTAGFTVSKNGVYTVTATDSVGNVGRLEINVDWIHTHAMQAGDR